MSNGYFNQKGSIGHLKTDPLRNFRFIVEIHDGNGGFGDQLGFMSVSGLSITTEVIPYRQGGHNTTTQKMPGQSDFAPLTLSRGLQMGRTDKQSSRWMRQLFSVQQGAGARGGADLNDDFRHRVTIKVLDHPVTQGKVPVKAAWRVYNAWPTSVAFSDLDAGANAIVITQMTLAHEGWEFALADGIGYNKTAEFN
jgi:phage tail-like protein